MSRCYDYVVEIDLPGEPENLPCRCGSCGWTGTALEVDDIEGCSLTPGDPSPVGRCPAPEDDHLGANICGALVYLDRPKDRAMEHAEEFVADAERVAGHLSDILTSDVDNLAAHRNAMFWAVEVLRARLTKVKGEA